MEDAEPKCSFKRIISYKNKEAEKRTRYFYYRGYKERRLYKAHRSSSRIKVHRLAYKISAFKIHLLADRKNNSRAYNRNSESAYLNKQSYHGLTYRGKGIVCINCEKSRNAYRACRGVESIDIRKLITLFY